MSVQSTVIPKLQAESGPKRRFRTRETAIALLFILPSLVGFIAFYAVPAVRGLLISFTDWDLLTPAKSVGFANYARLLKDPVFWNSLKVTVYYVFLNIPLQTILAVVIAVMMSRLTKSIIIRAIIILPWLMPGVVVGLLWLWLLDPTMGIVNVTLRAIGLPTISIVYNKKMLDAAGVTVEELNNASWNPEDGGTFGEIIAKLSKDANGNNGLSPNFDPTKVKQYGFVTSYNDGGGAYGQTQWSYLAASTGWRFIDKLYATAYHCDDPRFIATMDWFAGLMKKGSSVPFEQLSSLGGQAIFDTGETAALISDGSWMIGDYSNTAQFEFGFARLPIGPEGRQSMFNGLADSIWTGTKHPEEAWQWVKYLASPECANIVGEAGVVFPAQQSGVEKALAAYQAKGRDVSAFTKQALEPNGTFLFPVADHASEVSSIMLPVIQSILLGQTKAADALPAANAEINALFQ